LHIFVAPPLILQLRSESLFHKEPQSTFTLKISRL